MSDENDEKPEPSREELLHELMLVYGLLHEAAPLALRLLKTQCVDLRDQSGFWDHWNQLDRYSSEKIFNRFGEQGYEEWLFKNLDEEIPEDFPAGERRDYFRFLLKPSTG
jgi:hypothetical protein